MGELDEEHSDVVSNVTLNFNHRHTYLRCTFHPRPAGRPDLVE